MKLNGYIPNTISQFIRVYLWAIFFFFIFRLILFSTETARIDDTAPLSDILRAFLMGIRFDIVISGYIILLPFVVLTVTSYFKKQSRFLLRATTVWLITFFSLAFMVCAIDIPYFNQFFSRFSISAFEWMDSPVFVIKMILQEPRYWVFVIPFVLIVYFFGKIIRNIFLKPKVIQPLNPYLKGGISLIFILLIIMGIRGRLDEKSPIRIGTAYFSNNAFLNQLGLNPNFTLMKSYLESKKEENQKLRLMDDALAIANVQQYFGIENPDENLPLARRISFDSINPVKYNVVLILMESMSAGRMKRHGNTENLTPFLDSISNKGYYFENAYTAGIHTFNGIFSSIFSYPALFRQHPMKETNMAKFPCLFSTLKENGYTTVYFTTHDGQFDNVEGFLKANDCERIITKADYPPEEIKTTLGVPDDYMFRFSIPALNEIHKENEPFVSVFMTASNHGPYYVPDYYKPRTDDIKKQVIEYSDYSLEKFIKLAENEPWFENTIFVFIGDHGAPFDDVYQMSVNYNHSPLIFYAPHIFEESKTISDMAGQIDIFPTIMGMLKIDYVNNTSGIDLFREKRPYIYFGADDKFGVMDEEWFLIVNQDKSHGLYKYRDSDTKDYSGDYPEVTEAMKEYAVSNLQAYQYILENNKF